MADEKRIQELMEELKSLGCEVERRTISYGSYSKDKTKGLIGEVKEVTEDSSPLIIEKADSGKGFQLYADYSKLDRNKFKRLVRD